MDLGRVETALAVAMFGGTASAAAAWAAVCVREPRLGLDEAARRARRIALWMSLPAVLLAIAGLAMMLACFTAGRAHPMVQYTPDASMGYWDLWGSWFLFAVFALPVAAVLAGLSFLAWAVGPAWRAILMVRVLALAATGLVWYGTVTNAPDV